MSVFRYLKENVRLIIFYVLLMAFILSADYLDRENHMLRSDFGYILGVSAVLFLVYLIIDYLIKAAQIRRLLLCGLSKEKAPILPEPADRKDEVYCRILKELYDSHMDALHTAEADYRDSTDFIVAWAHEIKTPITTAKLLLGAGNIGSDELISLREEIEKIENDVEKALYYARSDQFSKDYLIADENLHTLVKESVKKHSALFIRKSIRLMDTLPEAVLVETDRKWLGFILDQLLSNALKYTADGGQITIRALKNDREQLLIIGDNGAGIRSEELPLLFSKSFTGSNGRMQNSRATGFGLYLSQKLAKKLGHTLTVRSEFGKGTEVTIHFPIWNDYYNVAKM